MQSLSVEHLPSGDAALSPRASLWVDLQTLRVPLPYPKGWGSVDLQLLTSPHEEQQLHGNHLSKQRKYRGLLWKSGLNQHPGTPKDRARYRPWEALTSFTFTLLTMQDPSAPDSTAFTVHHPHSTLLQSYRCTLTFNDIEPSLLFLDPLPYLVMSTCPQMKAEACSGLDITLLSSFIGRRLEIHKDKALVMV